MSNRDQAIEGGLALKYLPVNQAWAFFFGSALTSMGEWGTFFNEREAAVWAAATQGIAVTREGHCI